MAKELESLFAPASLAIVGASRDPSKWGYWIRQNMLAAGYAGRLYGVNPRAAQQGWKGSGLVLVPSLGDIEEPVDCVVIAIPQSMVIAAVTDCASLGVRFAVVLTAGFGETGEDGRAIEAEMIRLAKGSGLRLLGPNCFGVFSARGAVNFTAHPTIPGGRIALASQSGTVVIELSEKARAANLGWSCCVGVGNQIDIGFGELLHYFAEDSSSDAVALYVEGLRHGQAASFVSGLEACREANKPVVVIKAGRTWAGAASAASHTASLAGDDRVWSSILVEGGAVRVTSTEEMIDVLSVAIQVPRTSHRVMVLSDAGGSTVMTADAIGRSRSLQLADLSLDTVARLAPLVPPLAPRSANCNPMTLDTPGGLEADPRLLFDCARIAAEDPGVDLLAVVGSFGGYRALSDKEVETADRLLSLERSGVPLLLQSAFASADVESLSRFRSAGLRIHSTSDPMIAALDAWVSSGGGHSEVRMTQVDRTQPGSIQVPTREAFELLASYGIRTAPIMIIQSPAKLAEQLSLSEFPVCLKIGDPAVVHKSDVSGVRLNLGDFRAAKAAAGDLWERFPNRPLLLMHSYPPAVEVLIGGFHDQTFGATVIVGRGGTWTEHEDDVIIRSAPVDEASAAQMLTMLRMSKLLLGYRGQPAVDLAGLATIVANLSRLIRDHTDIAVDLNPVLAYQHEMAIVDVRILRTASAEARRPAGQAPPVGHK
jgi:acetyltransferase